MDAVKIIKKHGSPGGLPVITAYVDENAPGEAGGGFGPVEIVNAVDNVEITWAGSPPIGDAKAGAGDSATVTISTAAKEYLAQYITDFTRLPRNIFATFKMGSATLTNVKGKYVSHKVRWTFSYQSKTITCDYTGGTTFTFTSTGTMSPSSEKITIDITDLKLTDDFILAAASSIVS